jgi:hypothetical protein
MRGKDCKHVQAAFDLKDAYDCSYASGELGYENCECAPMPFNSAFNTHTYTGQNLYYCDDCMNGTADSFGCVSLKRNQYCILNKQYTKEEYELMKAKIIEHMKKTGEWGEFFPIDISPFAYNETNAAEYFPLTKEEALTRGYKWKDEDENQSYQGAVVQVPDTVEEVTEDFIQKILTCEVSGKLYKIIPQEFAFYKKMGIPLPLRSPEQRHKDRMEFQNPRKLWDRKCETCVKEIQSTYAPERSEKVYCEDCYLKLVY